MEWPTTSRGRLGCSLKPTHHILCQYNTALLSHKPTSCMASLHWLWIWKNLLITFVMPNLSIIWLKFDDDWIKFWRGLGATILKPFWTMLFETELTELKLFEPSDYKKNLNDLAWNSLKSQTWKNQNTWTWGSLNHQALNNLNHWTWNDQNLRTWSNLNHQTQNVPNHQTRNSLNLWTSNIIILYHYRVIGLIVVT